jgi:hypothetical protein
LVVQSRPGPGADLLEELFADAPEALARGADERHRLGEEHPHGVAHRDGLCVGRPVERDLREGRGRQLDGRVQRERRELLALRLLHVLRLLLGELTQPAQQIFGVAPKRESEAAAFHTGRVARSMVAR